MCFSESLMTKAKNNRFILQCFSSSDGYPRGSLYNRRNLDTIAPISLNRATSTQLERCHASTFTSINDKAIHLVHSTRNNWSVDHVSNDEFIVNHANAGRCFYCKQSTCWKLANNNQFILGHNKHIFHSRRVCLPAMNCSVDMVCVSTKRLFTLELTFEFVGDLISQFIACVDYAAEPLNLCKHVNCMF